MNYSSFNRRNLKPRKNNIKSFLSSIYNFISGKNNKLLIEKSITKKAFRRPNKIAGSTKKEIKKIIIKLFYLVVILSVFLFISWFLFSSPFFKIKNVSINIENQKYVESLNKIVDNQKQQTKFFWKQDNIFIFNKNSLIDSINKISNGFFYNIVVIKRFPNRIDINLKERSPKVVFITDQYKYYFDEDAKMILKSKNNIVPVVVNAPLITSTPQVTIHTTAITNNVIKDNNTAKTNKTNTSPDNAPKTEENILKELMNNQIEKDSGVKAVDITNDKIANNNSDIENLKNSLNFSNKEGIFKDYKFPEVYLCQNIDLKDYDINKNVISFIANLSIKLPNKAINIKKIFLETIDDLKLTVTTDVGYDIYFNTSKDIDQQIEYLGIVIKDKIKDDIKKIKYIDLRFGSKIFYK